jgi:hypothetical protein
MLRAAAIWVQQVKKEPFQFASPARFRLSWSTRDALFSDEVLAHTINLLEAGFLWIIINMAHAMAEPVQRASVFSEILQFVYSIMLFVGAENQSGRAVSAPARK